MDTGSVVDLVGSHDFDESDHESTQDVGLPINLSTANGRMTATKRVEIQVVALADVVKRLLLNIHL